MSSYFSKLGAFELALAGKAYSVSFTSTLASAGIAYLQITTGSKQCVILDWVVSADGQPLTMEGIENPTLTSGTTAIPSYKMNRNFSGNATTLFYSDPTSISGGTVIYTDIIPSTKGTGGSVGDAHAWVLKTNEDYLWKITNIGNQTTTIAGVLVFVESIVP